VVGVVVGWGVNEPVQVSVVFGVLVGRFFLKEEGTVMCLVGALFVAGGVAVIKFFG
jgi:uncharacterized membrane protein